MEIIRTANHQLLIVSGAPSLDDIAQAWELIIQINSEVTGRMEYLMYLNMLKAHKKLWNKYQRVRALLLKAKLVFDKETVLSLRKHGFKIRIDGQDRITRSINYANSLNDATHQARNMRSKLTIKKNQIDAFMADAQKDKGGGAGFEEIMANLCAALGFEVKDDILLARFNEYNKVIKRKNPTTENA